MEQLYNCRRYQYETGEHVTFYKRAVTKGKESQTIENLNKTHDTSERTEEQIKHCIKSANSRAKNKVYRIARSNTWDWFITFTFERTKTDASDYDEVVEKLQTCLEHIRQRKCPNMKYLIVAELHADKTNYHFHGLLANCDELRFRFWKVDRKKNLPIYNIVDWSYGFSTATRVQDTSRVSSYITKYITKDVDHHLKEKRRFYYSRNCNIAEEELFLFDEEDFLKVYNDRIIYTKTVDVPQAHQQIHYYELAY